MIYTCFSVQKHQQMNYKFRAFECLLFGAKFPYEPVFPSLNHGWDRFFYTFLTFTVFTLNIVFLYQGIFYYCRHSLYICLFLFLSVYYLSECLSDFLSLLYSYGNFVLVFYYMFFMYSFRIFNRYTVITFFIFIL